MVYEVEVKAPTPAGVEERLDKAGAVFVGEESHSELFFVHPCRDFKETDEVLRVREVGGGFVLTYKGPRVSVKTKTREEAEAEVSGDVFEILKKLGFGGAFRLRKKRRVYELEGFEVVLDDVEGLGRYIEAESKNPDDEDRIRELLMGLGASEDELTTKTYIELLEEKNKS